MANTAKAGTQRNGNRGQANAVPSPAPSPFNEAVSQAASQFSQSFAPASPFLQACQNQWQDQCQQAATYLFDQTERASDHMMNSMNDFTSLSRDLTNASLQYCQTWSKSCEEWSRNYMSLCQSLTQDCMNAFKSTLSARTLQDAVSTQSDFMRQQYEKVMTESSRFSEQFAKTASEAAEPVQSQWSNVTNKFSQAAQNATNNTSQAA